MARHRHFDDAERAPEPVASTSAAVSAEMLDSGAESDGAPDQISVMSSKRLEKQREKQSVSSMVESRRARKASNRARDASLKAAATQKRKEPVSEALPESLDDPAPTTVAPAQAPDTRLPASVFAIAQNAFDVAQEAEEAGRTLQAKAKVKRRRKEALGRQDGSRQIDSHLTLMHLPNRGHDVPVLTPADALPSKSKRKFLRNRLEKRPGDKEGARKRNIVPGGRRAAPVRGFVSDRKM